MKGLGYDLLAPNRGDAYAAQYQCRALAKLVCTRLAIQGIVHCTVVNKCSFFPRWKFNLTVSIKYWYINEGRRAFLVWFEILGGDCWNMRGFLAQLFNNSMEKN